jgi:muconolactone D-isomerase
VHDTFLVHIRNNIPLDFPHEEKALLMSMEADKADELVRQGVITCIFRVVGRRENVGVWRASSSQELHDVLTSLPMYPHLDITVTPLAAHPCWPGLNHDSSTATEAESA